MKRLHRRDLFCWSEFQEHLDIDFNGFAWIREGGNVLFDPPPLTPHDQDHLRKLGGVAWVVVTNSDHERAVKEVASEFGARLAGPAEERESFPIPCDRWLKEGDEPFPGLVTLELEGSKTPGELAFLLEDRALIVGDLIRSHRAGSLMMLLPEQGLRDREKAIASIARLLRRGPIDAVLVGDGWCTFHDGSRRLEDLLRSFEK